MILVDTLEKKNVHVIRYFDAHNIPWKPLRLAQGDYMLEGNDAITIDRKSGLQEVYGNLIGSQHVRFRNECIRAQEAGQSLVVLIETQSKESFSWNTENEPPIEFVSDVHKWVNPRTRWFFATRKSPRFATKKKQYPPLSSASLQRMMETMTEKYGVVWRFTPKNRCGEEIAHLLGFNDFAE